MQVRYQAALHTELTYVAMRSKHCDMLVPRAGLEPARSFRS